jgi:hypothetical protein
LANEVGGLRFVRDEDTLPMELEDQRQTTLQCETLDCPEFGGDGTH